MFQNFDKTFSRIWLQKLPKISYYQAFGKCFSNSTTQLKRLYNRQRNSGSGTCKRARTKPVLVPTGIKSYMQEDEYPVNNSSNPLKHFLVPNGIVGIVDSDTQQPWQWRTYYFQLLNFGLFDKEIKKAIVSARNVTVLKSGCGWKKTIWTYRRLWFFWRSLERSQNSRLATSFVCREWI